MSRTIASAMGCALLLACAPADHGPAPAHRAAGPRDRRASTPPPRRPPPMRRARPAPRRVRPPVRRVQGVNAASWASQQAAWTRLVKRTLPLARKGARLPTTKLRKHFRRLGLWELPSFDVSKLSAKQRALLSAKGAAHTRDANGPAGRQLWVETDDAAGRKLALHICAQTARCGLGCTHATKPPSNPREARIRQLVRMRRDHDLVLRIASRRSTVTTTIAVPTKSTTTAALEQAIRRASRSLTGTVQYAASPVDRLVIGLTVTGEPARVSQGPAGRLAHTLCQLAATAPDKLMAHWLGDRATQRRRAQALASWLGLSFVDKPVHSKRPKLEHLYIRRHYRDRVFNWRRRADGAYLIRPAMVVLHHTGGLSLRSALYTLTSLKLGSRGGLTHPKSLSVGVPYIVARNGRIYRLFKDDNRFGRHTIGLNHSALGIENVGTKRSGFTPVQLRSNALLVKFLAIRYPLRYLVGHREVYQMARTPYYLEAVPRYCSNKNDPPRRVMRILRKRLRSLGLSPAPTTRPVLKGCRAMRRYFKQRRRAARHRPR